MPILPSFRFATLSPSIVCLLSTYFVEKLAGFDGFLTRLC
jgi:hypothetical protein